MGRFGIQALPLDEVRVLVGHGIEKLLEKAVGADRAAEGVLLFREHYPRVAAEKTRLMPEVPEVLSTLDARGYKMAIASNKPARFSRAILEACGIARYFVDVAGPAEDIPTKPDPTMLRRLMTLVSATPEETIVVGDMEVDSEFARAAGCRVVLVPSGSRTRKDLLCVDADALLDSLSDLPAWIESNA